MISKTIEVLITKNGKTKKDVYEFVGMSKKAFYDNLKADNWRLDVLEKICQFFNITLCELFKCDDGMLSVKDESRLTAIEKKNSELEEELRQLSLKLIKTQEKLIDYFSSNSKSN